MNDGTAQDILLPKRKHVRMREFDYHTPGCYFFTIVLQGRPRILSTVGDHGVKLSPAGNLIEEIWWYTNTRYGAITTDEYVIMPDHMHGIVQLHADDLSMSPTSFFEFISWFKSFTTVEYGRGVKEQGWAPYAERFWQRDYIERYLRNERELEQYREYIRGNPGRWFERRS